MLVNNAKKQGNRYLGDEFVMVGQVCPAMDAAVRSMTFAGQVSLEGLHHIVVMQYKLCHIRANDAFFSNYTERKKQTCQS